MTTLALFPSELPALADSTDAQCTPRHVALALGLFDLDVCSNPRSHVLCRRDFQLERGEDGLSERWALPGRTEAETSLWCNGPFSAPGPWCERLRWHPGPWCSLWKLDPTTVWWSTLVTAPDAQWAPFRKRLAFERDGNCGGAEFPCALVWARWQPPQAVRELIWTPHTEARRE